MRWLIEIITQFGKLDLILEQEEKEKKKKTTPN